MQDFTRRNTLAALGVAFLGACGSGDSGSAPTGSGAPPSPPPPAPPPPPPPPPPPAQVGSFGTLGVSIATEFPVIGSTVRGTGTGWDFVPSAAGYNNRPAIKIRIAPPTGRFLTLPDLGEGELMPDADQGQVMAEGQRVVAFFKVFGSTIQLYRPIIVHTVLQYVMQAYFTSAPDPARPDPYLNAEFAYGSPTPTGSLPASGTGSYRTNLSDTDRIQADYAGRTVTGTVPLYGSQVAATGSLRETVISPDGVRFAGKIVATDGREGTIEGYFLGPTGEEFMARYEYPTNTGVPTLQTVVGARDI